MNQKLPAPEINCCHNDRIIVDVTNHLPGHGLTIHWHDVPQRDTPWFDGVRMITQCSINQDNLFRYAFTAAQNGSNNHHATGSHRTNGVIGQLTVRQSADPHASAYNFDLTEHSVLLTDWSNVLADNKEPGVRSTITQPDSILINGYGSYVIAKTITNHFYIRAFEKFKKKQLLSFNNVSLSYMNR